MKKNFSMRMLLTMIVAILFVGCSKTTDEHANVIPQRANVVVAFDVESLVKKLGFAESQELRNEIVSAIPQGESYNEFRELVNHLLSADGKACLDFSRPVFLFSTPEDFDNLHLSCKVNSVEKLSKLTLDALKASNVNVENSSLLSGVYKYKYKKGSGYFTFTFDDSKLLMSFEKDNTSSVDYFNLTSDKSFVTTEGYKRLSSAKGDFSMVYVSDLRGGIYKDSPLGKILNAEYLNGVCNLLVMSLEKGAIKFDMQSFAETEQGEVVIAEMKKMSGKMNNTFLEIVKETSPIVTVSNYNGEEADKVLRKMFNLKEFLGEDAVDKLFGMISMFNGDIAFELGNEVVGMMPTINMYAEVKDETILEKINQITGGLYTKTGENTYEYSSFIKVFMGMKDGKFYVTTSPVVAHNPFAKAEKPFSKTSASKLFRGANSAFLLDVDKFMAHPLIAMSLGFAQGNPEVAPILEFVSTISTIEGNTDAVNGKFSINFKNKEEYPLKDLLKKAVYMAKEHHNKAVEEECEDSCCGDSIAVAAE